MATKTTIPEEIRKKIADQLSIYASIEDEHGRGVNTTKFNAFSDGAEFGYSLSQQPVSQDTLDYEKLIAFLSTDCGLLDYRWDEGLNGVDRIISFLKHKFKEQPVSSSVEDKSATQILCEHGIYVGELNDDFNTQLLYSMERYAEQYGKQTIKGFLLTLKVLRTVLDKAGLELGVKKCDELINEYSNK